MLNTIRLALKVFLRFVIYLAVIGIMAYVVIFAVPNIPGLYRFLTILVIIAIGAWVASSTVE